MAKEPAQRSWRGKFLSGIVKSCLWLLSCLPLAWNQALGRLLGRLLWWLPTESKRVTLINLATAFPDKPLPERQALAQQSLQQLGQMSLELGPAWMGSQAQLEPKIIRIENQALLQQALDSEKGALLLTPHIGSWEMLVNYISWVTPMTLLYRPPNVAALEGLMRASRGRFGGTMAPTNVLGVRLLHKALKAGETALVLPDQDAGEKGGKHAPFFGFPARTMTLASKLVQKHNCHVLFLVLERLPQGQGYVLHALSAPQGLDDADELTATTALNQGVEACVKLLPEQYLWSYKRYRKPPAGFDNPYKK